MNEASYWMKNWLQFTERYFQLKQPTLLAVSGGVDSMVMVHLFREGKFPFAVAHMNFQLRGQSSEEDLVFVKETCEQAGILFFENRVETKQVAAEKNISIEMAARELRYSWLEEIRKKNGYHRIATAHHLDDSIETTLLNMFHGTGIRGISGIPWTQGHIIRPMMCFFKNEIEQLAAANQIAFREDHTNRENNFQRNQIRNDLIPAIEKYFPSFRQMMAQNISHWYHTRIIYEEAIGRKKRKLVKAENDLLKIPVAKLSHMLFPETMLFEVLHEYGFHEEQVKQILTAMSRDAGKVFYSPSHRLLKDRKHLILSKKGDEQIAELLIHEEDRKAETGAFAVTFEKKEAKNFSLPKDSIVCCLDFGLLEFPLVLRQWKRGDYFYPLGMKRKKKKVSDFLIDQKIPLTEKKNVFVIESGKKIAGVVALRIDDRFKTTPSTRNVFVIRKK